jgi:hypothetical protein
MGTFNEVQNNLHFLNNGSSQVPDLVVMQLDANGGHYGLYKHILVVFNASTSQQSFTATSLEGMGFRLHPEQQLSTDSVVKNSKFDRNTGIVVVPGLTTAVFVSTQ